MFLPEHGMLGASLRCRGVELLRRVEDLEGAAAKGSTAGIPLLHPWANRLAGLSYEVAGKTVTLEGASSDLHYDGAGLPIHGVPWSRLVWRVVAATQERVTARLDWARDALLAVFPFPHALDMTVTLRADALTIETTLSAGEAGAVPVSFGFHPYLGLPDLPRKDWRLTLPAMRHLKLDGRGIPTGEAEDFDGLDAPLGARVFDDGFALDGDGACLSVAGGGRRLSVELIEGYGFTQVYAPPGQELIALEPMTAPTNALVSGQGLRMVQPGETFRAAFRIRVEAV